MGDYQRGTGTIVHVQGVCAFQHERALKILKMLTYREPNILFISTTLDLAGCPIHPLASEDKDKDNARS
jgi:hypothetical protein